MDSRGLTSLTGRVKVLRGESEGLVVGAILRGEQGEDPIIWGGKKCISWDLLVLSSPVHFRSALKKKL